MTKSSYMFLLLCFITLSSCDSQHLQYKGNLPALQFENFFADRLCAWGTIHDTGGELTRKFVATIDASTMDGITRLEEEFLFNDGEVQQRVWLFERKGESLTGTAGDVVGVALGQLWGDSLNLKYTLLVKTDSNEWEISMDDWLHLVDESTLLGVTKMSKFGLSVGEIRIAIQKRKKTQVCIQSETQKYFTSSQNTKNNQEVRL